MNILRFLRWMQERRWPVYLYARPGSPLFVQAAEFGVPARPLISGSKASDLFYARSLAGLIGTDGVRVLIMHQSHDLLMCVLSKICRGGRLKVVYQQHMHIAGDKRDILHAWQYRRLDAFVSPVPSLAEQVRKRTVLQPGQLHVIPLGIEIERFLAKPPREQARRELGLPIEAKIIGVVGRLDPKKGQHVAIGALRRAHDAGCRPHLLVVGAPTRDEHAGYHAYLHQLADELHLTSFVHFRPHLEDPVGAFAAMDIFVLPSQSETYGMVTIEALASGLPVIGTDAGGTVDLIDHERTGLRFPPGDEVALGNTLVRLMNDSALATRLAGQGRQDAVTKYSHQRQCDRWGNLLRQLTT